MKLTDNSTDCVIFGTPSGQNKFTRMSCGICSAPDVFQVCFYNIFWDIEGVEIYIDDILVWGAMQEEHDKRLEHLLKRAETKCSLN